MIIQIIACSERDNLNENYIEKNPNFWNYSSGCGQTRSLPRPKRKVKFKDDPPERPPPPAPERHTTSFQVQCTIDLRISFHISENYIEYCSNELALFITISILGCKCTSTRHY